MSLKVFHWFNEVKMSKTDNIIKTLKQIEAILRACCDTNWLPAIENFISQLTSAGMNDDQFVIIREIMGIYGGMGSFNDLVLFNGGKVCYKENEQLDILRKKLYEQCKALLITR